PRILRNKKDKAIKCHDAQALVDFPSHAFGRFRRDLYHHQCGTCEPGTDLLLPIGVLDVDALGTESREAFAGFPNCHNPAYFVKRLNELFLFGAKGNHPPECQWPPCKVLVHLKRTEVDDGSAHIISVVREIEASAESFG